MGKKPWLNCLPKLTSFPGHGDVEDRAKLFSLLEQYKKYKKNFAQNIKFDPNPKNLSILNYKYHIYSSLSSGTDGRALTDSADLH